MVALIVVTVAIMALVWLIVVYGSIASLVHCTVMYIDHVEVLHVSWEARQSLLQSDWMLCNISAPILMANCMCIIQLFKKGHRMVMYNSHPCI